ncbi:amino acid adenylation domain-containing protein [Pseudonocardia sp. MCCB 268]|nr:amino acid adenylation domain-containing protein [Pseudonocardia cytotoxica]
MTETSDDFTHAVLDRLPAHGRVRWAASAQHRRQVVDENLVPVPLGAPGEIVCSGVCVGRGYIRDPGAPSRRSPPTRTGRSGAVPQRRPRPLAARQHPGFLGRRDTQVKIRSFGSRSAARSRTPSPGARRAGRGGRRHRGADGGKHLVAFYAAGQPIQDTLLRERLAASLPSFTWCPPRSTTGPRSRSTSTARSTRER